MPKAIQNVLETAPVSQDNTSRGSKSGADRARKSNKVEFVIETITPDMARDYLGNKVEGREADRNAVTAYAEAMRAGAWMVNGMPIIFGPTGKLLDGVTRLEACIAADTPFTTLVARNVREDTLHTIDQHRRRSYQGVLEARGERNAGALIRTMGKLIRIENGVLGLENLQISWTRYDRVLDANPLLREAVELSLSTRAARLHSTARHALVFMALAANKRPALRQFLAAISDPDVHPMDNPGRVLAMQIDVFKDSNDTTMDIDRALALGILAFEALREGKKVTKPFKWKPDFGKAKLTPTGVPVSRREAREKAPPNMGLPKMEGYPGLEDGKFDPKGSDEITGPLAETLRSSAGTADGVTIEFVTVTPELAQEWLQNHNRNNRKIQKSHVKSIMRDILGGNWMFNAQPICFGKDGRLLNGQHRLSACVEAEAPIDVVVVRGISDAAFATYDIQAKRSVVSVGQDKVDPRVVAAAAKIQWRVDNGIGPAATAIKPTSSELHKTLEDHPKLADGFSQARRMMSIGSAAVMTFLIYHTRHERPDIAGDFLQSLETGENLVAANPLLRVRNALLSQRGDDKRKDRLQTLLEAWNNYKEYRDQQGSLLV